MKLLYNFSGTCEFIPLRPVFQHVPENSSKGPRQASKRQETSPEKASKDATATAMANLERLQPDTLKVGLAKMYNLATFENLIAERPKKTITKENPKIRLEIIQENDIEDLRQIMEQTPAAGLALKEVFSDPEKYKPSNVGDIRLAFKTKRLLERDQTGDNVLASELRNLVNALNLHERLYVFLKAPEIVGRIESYNNEDNGWIFLKQAVLESFGLKQRYDTFH